MQLLNIRFSAIDESNFIVNARSGAGQAESRSSLPFYETKTKWRTTLIKILEIGKFSPDKFSDEEKIWMEQEGLLLSDGSGFSADYLEKIGQALYESLFPTGEVFNLLQRSIALAEQDHNPQLHIQIEFNAEITELNRLPDYPWETVHDGQRFLAHHNVTFSRYIAHLSTPPTLSAVSPINVLLVSSGASDEENGLSPLSKKEHEAVKKGLEKSQEDGHIRFSEPEQASFKTLTTYLTEHRGDDAPHVLHFDGHGVFGKRCLNSECRTFHGNLKLEKCKKCGTALSASQGYLLFEPDEDDDDELEANYVSAEEIGSLLRSIRHGDSESQQGGVRLAVLSACKSAYALGGTSVFNGVAQSLIGHGVPAVVAMQYTASTKGATAFAERFYRELGNKQSLAVATSQGRVAMQNVEHNQWYRLILYLRWQSNDGGQLFANSMENASSEKGDHSSNSSALSSAFSERSVHKFSLQLSEDSLIPTPNYLDLLGRDKELDAIKDALSDLKGKRIVGISGLGGTGKTAVAIEVAKSFRELGFKKFIWQTASSASFKSIKEASQMTFEKVLDEIAKQLSRRDLLALQGEERERKTRDILLNERTLVILDNMETAGEPQDEIAAKLSRILGNSKLLLTSRRRFETLETDIFDYHLLGLNKEAGIELIKQTASQRNISVLQDSDLEPLINHAGNDRMGYSPLAVKFIVGQRGHKEQKEILRSLENIRLPQNEYEVNDNNLFFRFWSHIFSESYQLMEKTDQTLFSILVGLDPSHGTSHDTICRMLSSNLTQDEIEGAISHTWYLSLLEIERDKTQNKQLYSMHLLTNRFFVKMLKKYNK